jgi:hypothetical protein
VLQTYNSSANLISNNFLRHETQTSNEVQAQWPMSRAGTIQNLFVKLYTSAAGDSSSTFTLRKNGVNTALTTTIAASTQTGADNVNAVSVDPFDLISLQVTFGAGNPTSGGTASIEFTP